MVRPIREGKDVREGKWRAGSAWTVDAKGKAVQVFVGRQALNAEEPLQFECQSVDRKAVMVRTQSEIVWSEEDVKVTKARRRR